MSQSAPGYRHPTPDANGPPPRHVAVEICVDDVEGAMLAEAGGADRIELCSALSEGGITPSIGLVRSVFERVGRIGVQVMIRPRGGDFTVDRMELGVMLADIEAIMALRRSPAVRLGFVFGVLTGEGEVDTATTRRLVTACAGHPTTFHKAFDRITDQGAALETLVGLGVDRVLTSGGAPTAESGAEALRQLVERAGDRIAILAGGGVRAHNAAAVVARTSVSEIHLRAMREVPGRPPVTCAKAIEDVMRAAGDPLELS